MDNNTSHSEEDDSLIFDTQRKIDSSIIIETDGAETKKIPIESKKQRNKFEWTEDKKFTTLKEAEDYLISQEFVFFDVKNLISGQKFYYRCSKIPKDRKRCEWCNKRFIIFLPSDSTENIVQCNGQEHNHEELLLGKRKKISNEMKEFIRDLFEKDVCKPNAILTHIDSAREKHGLFQSEENPGTRQIEYLVAKFRQGDSEPVVNLGDLMKWCQSNAIVPTNDDEPFVLSHAISTNEKNENGFHFCITTLRLLLMLSQAKKICIDATYKINWLGYPLIVLGTVDRKKKFHPMIYACSSNETTNDYKFIFESVKNGISKCFNKTFSPEILIADGAEAIRNAFFDVFKESAALFIMCAAHMLRNVKKRPLATKTNRNLIIEDIRKIQLAPNKSIFEMMSRLFLQKWKNEEPDFVRYFKSEWLGDQCNWYEGAAEYTPSTNNALESYNSLIKRLVTFRRRLPLQEFLSTMKSMTANISMEFAKNNRSIATEPEIARKNIIAAAEMNNNGFKKFKASTKKDVRNIYVLPSQKCSEPNANEKYYKMLNKKEWKTFDEYITYGYQKFWLVKLSKENWTTKSSCTCPIFFKHYNCKHVVAVAVEEKLFKCPIEANPMILTRKKGPGRNKNASKGLVRD